MRLPERARARLVETGNACGHTGKTMKTATKMALATTAFALLHSALASRPAKQAAARVVGERRAAAGYRLFYVGQSVLTFAGLVAYGTGLPQHTLYRVGMPAALLLRAGQAAGFALLFAAARRPGIARLTGVDGLRAYRRGAAMPPDPVAQGPEARPDGSLTIDGPYLWSRHPLNFCGVPIFWLTPHMTSRRLVFNLVSTAYFLLGSLHEERRLEAAYGLPYARYRRSQVPFFWPSPTQAAGVASVAWSRAGHPVI